MGEFRAIFSNYSNWELRSIVQYLFVITLQVYKYRIEITTELQRGSDEVISKITLYQEHHTSRFDSIYDSFK